MVKEVISIKNSRLIKPIYLNCRINRNGPTYDINPLKTDPRTKELGLELEDLMPSYFVIVNPKAHRGGIRGHYHNKKKEIYSLINGRLIFFVSDLSGNREIIDFDTRIPNNVKEGEKIKFPVVYLPPKVAHLVYNPLNYTQTLLVLSRYSDEEAFKGGDIIEFDAIGGELKKVASEIKL